MNVRPTLWLICAPLALSAQTTVDHTAPPVRTIAAQMVQHAIVLDGRLDEADWRDAPIASAFVQSEPRTDEPASESTEVRVLFDAERLYIGAYLHDREPARLVINDIRKDFLEEQQDDFEVLLDTFHDRANGYVFITNAEGARADRQVANEGREINTSWDGIWEVKTRRVDDGWIVEMAIPFRTLRFDFATAQNWGINFSRRIRRKNEVDFWSPVPRAFNLARVSLAGDLTGIAHDGKARDLRIKPYALMRSVRDIGATTAVARGDAGLDVKYGVTQSLALDVTVNPDFAQVEADEQSVNLTQFSQFFPEKREFFLENSGIFYIGDAARNNRVSPVLTPDEDMVLFFSRRIGLAANGTTVRTRGGLRMTGALADLSVGALSMQTQASASTPANQYSALRLRRNLMPGTDVGLVLLDREGLGATNNWNRLAGLDGTVRLPGNYDWSSYAVGSRKPGAGRGQYTYRTSVTHEGNYMHVKAGVLEVGPGFTNDMGYFRRTDTRKYLLDFGVRPRPRWLAPLGIREMHPHVTWSYYQNLNGDVGGKVLHSGYTVFYSNGGFTELSVNPNYQRIYTPFNINSRIAPIPVGGYHWNDYQLKGGTDASRSVSVTYTLLWGGLWSGTQRSQIVSVAVQPDAHFGASVGVSHTEASLDVPKAKFEALLWTSRARYSVNTHMFVDAFTQYDPRSRLLNANMRFNLIHHPLSDLFVVVNQQRIATPDAPVTGFGVIIKATQTLSF